MFKPAMILAFLAALAGSMVACSGGDKDTDSGAAATAN
jgi:hypothetical protein